MKPFDLELAKKKHPVQTRDGRSVRITCFDKKGDDYKIVALVEDIPNKSEILNTYTSEGKYLDNDEESSFDLFMTSVKKEGWVNIFRRKGLVSDFYEAKAIYQTKEFAEEMASGNADYVTTIKISWEE